METVDLNMEDIFDEQEDFPTVGALPDLPEEDGSIARHDDENEDDAENSEVLSKLKDLSKGAAKKVVRKPIPKLDATRLCGERGIPILPKTFQGIKFKGKGHEAKDLGVIMRYLEHWAHRLFPKMPFDEVLERIERLGTKKEVQSCIKRMRLDMPILSDDFVGEADDEEENGPSNGADENGATQPVNRDAEDIWDEMIRDEEEAMNEMPSPVKTSHLRTALSQPDTPISTNSYAPSTPSTPSTPVQNGNSSLSIGLTPEQVERMERNKRLAMEKRNKGKSVFKVPATPSSTHGSPLSQTKTPPSTTASNSLENGISATLTDSDAMSEIISQQDRKKSTEGSNITENSLVESNSTENSFAESNSTENSSKETNTTSLTNGFSESQMSEVIPVIDNGKDNQNSTYDSSQEMSEVIPLVCNMKGDNSGDCSPSKMRKVDNV